jgi:hypothetical protein
LDSGYLTSTAVLVEAGFAPGRHVLLAADGLESDGDVTYLPGHGTEELAGGGSRHVADRGRRLGQAAVVANLMPHGQVALRRGVSVPVRIRVLQGSTRRIRRRSDGLPLAECGRSAVAPVVEHRLWKVG